MSTASIAPSPAAGLPAYKLSFINTCVTNSILRFGTFTLKSGRVSPYFFQAGAFNTGSLLSSLATAYAETILQAFPAQAYSVNSKSSSAAAQAPFDLLFGPAYKGIPLATITALKLAELDPVRFEGLGYAFNRKEAKSHGEGGSIVGMPLAGKRVLIVDDVITAGTAIRESVGIIRESGGVVVGIVVALDRMERVREGSEESAIAEVRREVGCGVWSVLSLEELVEVGAGTGASGETGGVAGLGEEEREGMRRYREVYGARKV
ncbi:phosphoribosyltransferase-like protein [Kalaharituber pfeilii]|nr:phosphoribosyltransferase-like protein [Kalaharituber pfeilii]